MMNPNIKQRVRYTLASDRYVGEGWGYIDGPWFHVLDNEHNRWTTYPQHSVVQIEWQA